MPTGYITPDPASPTAPIIHFPSVSPTIIPRQTFCSLPISLLHSGHRILSNPICLSSPSYPRNEFLFNFSLVLAHTTEPTAYASVVSKLAALFTNLETSSSFLSHDYSPPNTGRIFALCEILLEDLNNYCECMIPIDYANTLNIKLFPTYPPPPPLCPQDVPLATARLEALTDENWDLTMLRILPLIDGVNSVRQIALRADAAYKLVRKAIAHLLYYGCVILLDVFNYGASYAPTAEMGAFITDREIQEEGLRYVLLAEGGDIAGTMRNLIDGPRLVELYCSLRQGQTLKSWYLEHAPTMDLADLRRFITFGVIKGFLYRVHKYAIAAEPEPVSGINNGRPRTEQTGQALRRLLDGTHCFDEICTELMISEVELMGKLRSWGDVQIIQR